MRAQLGSAVEWGQLRDVVLLGLAAGVGLPAVFAVTVLGSIHLRDRRAQGRCASALDYAALAVIGAAVCAAGIIAGILLR